MNITCWLVAITCLISCKKDNTPAGPGGPGGTGGNNPAPAYFFANTEWTGSCHIVSQQYDLPCYLRFNGDSTVSVYALFYWQLGGSFQAEDSAVGKITGIDTVTNGNTSINVSFALTGDKQTYTLTNKNTLVGVTAAGSTASSNNTFSPHLQLCPAPIPSVKNTSWSSKKMTGGGPTDGMYAYPDLATFSFGDKSQVYYRNGSIITYTPSDQLQILLMEYSQQGPRIYLSGFNETNNLLVGYFGVLAPDGASMLVDARAKRYARLPNYLQTIYWYGPPGVTPVIYKQ
jgi:hypothetical protein